MNYLIDISKASVAPPQSAVWSWNIHVLNNLALAVNVCVNRDLQQTTHNWQSRVEALLVLDMQRNTRFMNKSQRPLFIIFGMVASALFCVLLSLWNLFMETWKKTNKYLFSISKRTEPFQCFQSFQQIINTWIMYRFTALAHSSWTLLLSSVATAMIRITLQSIQSASAGLQFCQRWIFPYSDYSKCNKELKNKASNP